MDFLRECSQALIMSSVKAVLLIRTVMYLALMAAPASLSAQQNQTDRKLFEEVNALAEQGEMAAQYNLGVFYFEGVGIPKDASNAVRWFRKAAEQGSPHGQNNLAACLKNGDGVEKDEKGAVEWFRKAAAQGLAPAQLNLGILCQNGNGTPKDDEEAAKWYRAAAEQGDSKAQVNLGVCYAKGQGVPKDEAEAVRWYLKAAAQNEASALFNLGDCYDRGVGVSKSSREALKWFRKAGESGDAKAQYNVGIIYAHGDGTPKDETEAYKWFLLAGAQGVELAKDAILVSERRLTADQRAEGQRLAKAFTTGKPTGEIWSDSPKGKSVSQATSSGTGFFITEDGFLITNEHVVKEAAQVRLVTSAGIIAAKVVKVDAANDLALLKAEGRFAALPVVASRGMRLGSTVATVGFPNVGLQGFAPKLARGEIAALSGAQDDARYFQISVPVQPGNSGGALVDELGNVVGVVSAKLSARAALAASGALPENVNYAVKSSFLLSFLESVPEVSAKLKDANTKERKFEDVVKSVEQAAVLVLVY